MSKKQNKTKKIIIASIIIAILAVVMPASVKALTIHYANGAGAGTGDCFKNLVIDVVKHLTYNTTSEYWTDYKGDSRFSAFMSTGSYEKGYTGKWMVYCLDLGKAHNSNITAVTLEKDGVSKNNKIAYVASSYITGADGQVAMWYCYGQNNWKNDLYKEAAEYENYYNNNKPNATDEYKENNFTLTQDEMIVEYDSNAKNYTIGPFSITYPYNSSFSYIKSIDLNYTDGEGKEQTITPEIQILDNTAGLKYPGNGQTFYLKFNNTINAASIKLNIKFKYLANVQADGYFIHDNSYYGAELDYQRIGIWQGSREWAEYTISTEIPLTINLGGMVWEDVRHSKTSNINGKYEETISDSDTEVKGELGIPNVTVSLYRADNNEVIKEVTTDNEGKYEFLNVSAQYKYYVKFMYNGLYYQPTTYFTNGDTDWEINSKALELESDRNKLNSQFAEIGSYPNNYVSGNSKGWLSASSDGKVYNKSYTRDQLLNFSGTTVDGQEIQLPLIDDYGNLTVNLIADENITRWDNRKGYGYNEPIPALSKDTLSEMKSMLQFIYDCRNYAETYGTTQYYAYTGNANSDDPNMHINLGLTLRDSVDIGLNKDLYSARLTINGKEEVYTDYNSRNNKIKDSEGNYISEISVRLADSNYYNDSYSRNIYQADYNYTGINSLEMYLSYRIMLNEHMGTTGAEITEIVDYYDDTFAGIVENGTYIGDKEGNKTEDCTISSSSIYGASTQYNIDGYTSTYIRAANGEITLEPGGEKYIYVTLQVGKDENGKLKVASENNSKKNNLAEINGYKTSTGVIDRDSTPGNLTSSEITTFEDDTDKAPTLKIVVTSENPRTISGNIWIENRDTEVDKAEIGNGIRDSGEEAYTGTVNVTLHDANTGDLVKTWETANGAEATLDTNSGSYAISNVIPGDYYLEFVYPDGRIYKTTIYKQTGFDANNPDTLGKLSTLENANDARDIYGSNTGASITLNNGVAKNVTDTYRYNVTDADSNKEITNKEDNVATRTEKTMLAVTGDTSIEISSTGMTGVDLGLVEIPKAQLMVNEKVSNVKVTLANNTVLFDATGTATNVLWVDSTDSYDAKDLYNNNKMNETKNSLSQTPKYRNGQSIQLTMDEENMYGATIKVTYKISVTNIGEVDYASKSFYYTGEKDASETAIKTEIGSIIDYVGAVASDDTNATINNLKFNKDEVGNESWNIVSATDLDGKVNFGTDTSDILKKYNTILTCDYNTELIPILLGEQGAKTDETTLVLSSIISSDTTANDMKFNNMVEIISYADGLGRKMAESIVGNQNPNSPASEIDADSIGSSVNGGTTILPPFGQTYIYYMLGIGVAAIAIVGIVLIKTKVLKKKTI